MFGAVLITFIMGSFFGFLACIIFMTRETKQPPHICTEIRIPARWDNDGFGERIREAVFKLGLGPCGKEATRLSGGWEQGGKVYIVSQWCGDEQKLFHYRYEDITGRIVKTYNGGLQTTE